MKQGILITAYKNYNHLENIISSFDENFEIYIHIDKKSTVSEEWLRKLNNYKNVKLISRKYRVNWGGFNHLKSILYLSKMALLNKEINYFHLISGHDYPIKSSSDFLNFFTDNTCYINYFEVPFENWDDNGGLDRIEYFNFYDLFNWKNLTQRKVIKKIIHYQRKFGFKRSVSNKIPQLYGGSTWWSLTRGCLEYVLKYSKANKFFFNTFKYTFCSEELYFQTIIMNSNFRDYALDNNLRYIDWSNRNGNCPAVLDITDFKKVIQSDAFFARKFDYPVSQDLLCKLKEINNESNK